MGPCTEAFLTAEAIDEKILHPGEYASTGGGTELRCRRRWAASTTGPAAITG